MRKYTNMNCCPCCLRMTRAMQKSLLEEIKIWLDSNDQNLMDYGYIGNVHKLVENCQNPWKYVKDTRENHFIDEYILLKELVYKNLPT